MHFEFFFVISNPNLSFNALEITFNLSILIEVYFVLMFRFYTPWKRQKTKDGTLV